MVLWCTNKEADTHDPRSDERNKNYAHSPADFYTTSAKVGNEKSVDPKTGFVTCQMASKALAAT